MAMLKVISVVRITKASSTVEAPAQALAKSIYYFQVPLYPPLLLIIL